jgi:hypothetical protein
LDPKIVHLVVWTKFPLGVTAASDSITPLARMHVESWIAKTFHPRIASDHIRWFRNWGAIKSVASLEHIHIMLYDPDPHFIAEVTNGDVPMSIKAQNPGFTYAS